MDATSSVHEFTSFTPSALEHNLSRQNSYDLKSHKKVYKNLYDVLGFNFKLAEILSEQAVSQKAIPEEAIRSVRRHRDELNHLRNSIKKEKPKKSPKKSSLSSITRFSNLFRSERDDLYADDIKSLELLSDQLDVLTKTLNTILERKPSADVGPRKSSAQLTVRPRSHKASSSISHQSAPEPKNPQAEEEDAARHIFGLLNRSVYPYWGRHIQYSRERLPGTCDWILRNDAYSRWRAGHSQVLWCSGSAGTGKSFLMSKIVDDLKSSSLHVAYFYFGRGLVQNFADVVGSLLSQIKAHGDQQSPHVAETNHRLEGSAHDDWNVLSIANFTRCFPPSTIVILDAYDPDNINGAEGEKFEQLIIRLKANGNKIFLASRSLIVPTALGQFLHIALPDEDQTNDLELYARNLISRNPDAPAYEWFMSDSRLLNDVVQDYSATSSFTRIGLFVSTLLRQTTRSQLEGMLIVEDPVHIYFSNHDGNVSGISQASVMWLLQSKHPMTISALQEVLALYESTATTLPYEEQSGSIPRYHADTSHHFPDRHRYPSLKFLQHCCKDLFWIDDISHTVTISGENLFQRIGQDSKIRNLADMCISYLSIDALEDMDYRDQDSVVRCANNHQFLRYACSAWKHHARRQEISPDMRPKYVGLMKSRRRLHTILTVEAWDRFHTVKSIEWQQLVRDVERKTAAHVAISCNDPQCLEVVLTEVPIRESGPSTDVLRVDSHDLQEPDLGELAMLAFSERKLDCFDVLYEKILDDQIPVAGILEAPDKSFVRWQYSRWKDVYKWFDKGHEITNFERDPTCLQTAVQKHDILALRSAWKRALGTEAEHDIGLYCLYTAIQSGDSKLASRLLDHGFKSLSGPSKSRPARWSPLHAASSKGDLSMVKKLLSCGADVRVLDGKGNTVLFPAIEAADEQSCSQPTLDLLELLLTNGVNLEAPCLDGPGYVTPIGCARNRLLPKVVEIFIMHGAKLSTDSLVRHEIRTGAEWTSVQHRSKDNVSFNSDTEINPVTRRSTTTDVSVRTNHSRDTESSKVSEANSEAQQEIEEMLETRQKVRQALNRAAARTISQGSISSMHSKQSLTTPSRPLSPAAKARNWEYKDSE